MEKEEINYLDIMEVQGWFNQETIAS